MNVWAKVKSHIFNLKPLWLLLGKIGLLFNLGSGHSDCHFNRTIIRAKIRLNIKTENPIFAFSQNWIFPKIFIRDHQEIVFLCGNLSDLSNVRVYVAYKILKVLIAVSSK